MQFLALDVWNGTIAQAGGFISATGISYPLLRLAAAVSPLYAGGYDYVYVVGGDGRVKYRDLSGFDAAEVDVAVAEALEELLSTDAPPGAGAPFRLSAPQPNPFNPSTELEIQFDAEIAAPFTLDVVDARGRNVRTLLRDARVEGVGLRVRFDGRDAHGAELPSGVYWFRLRAAGRQQVVRGALVR